MKKSKNLTLAQLRELGNGVLAGGFVAISNEASLIHAGEETNNCNAGNCVAGCGKGQNVVAGCGSVNAAPGCGTA